MSAQTPWEVLLSGTTTFPNGEQLLTVFQTTQNTVDLQCTLLLQSWKTKCIKTMQRTLNF